MISRISDRQATKSRIPCPNFGKSRFPGSSQIPNPVKIFFVFPNPAPYFGQIPDPKNTLPDPGRWIIVRFDSLPLAVRSTFGHFDLLLIYFAPSVIISSYYAYFNALKINSIRFLMLFVLFADFLELIFEAVRCKLNHRKTKHNI